MKKHEFQAFHQFTDEEMEFIDYMVKGGCKITWIWENREKVLGG